MGTDHNIGSVAGGNAGDVANQPGQELQDRDHPVRVSGNKEREGIRASQSFDESVGAIHFYARAFHRYIVHPWTAGLFIAVSSLDSFFIPGKLDCSLLFHPCTAVSSLDSWTVHCYFIPGQLFHPWTAGLFIAVSLNW